MTAGLASTPVPRATRPVRFGAARSATARRPPRGCVFHAFTRSSGEPTRMLPAPGGSAGPNVPRVDPLACERSKFKLFSLMFHNQAGAARVEPFRFSVADHADKVRLQRGALEEELVDERIVEPRERADVEPSEP
ncbi:hypothetical protein WMF19_34880 [Sorangium sp. So ce124]